MKTWRAEKKDHLNAYSKQYAKANRKQWITDAKLVIFDYYGHLCACCGEDIEKFLTIDHINNDGAALRRKGSYARSGTGFYMWLARQIKAGKAPTDLRTLCYNCNCGRQRNGGVCPHHG